jgi:hypothetical protein
MRYGPFPMRVGRLLAGMALLGLGLPVIALVGTPDRVRCARATGVCRLTRPLRDPTEFSASEFVAVRVEHSRGSKGRPVGRPIVVLGSREIPLGMVEPDAAEAFARRAEDALHAAAGATASDGVDVSLRQPWWFVAFAALIPVMGAGLVVTALRGVGRYRLEHDALRRELAVTRAVFHVPVSRRSVSTRDVVGVEIDWARDKDFFHSRYQLGDTTAKLVLVAADGERRPVGGVHRGYTLHRRAAAELAALLGCPPSPAAMARNEAQAATFHPPPSAFRGWNRLGAAWIGMCCGSLLGMAAYALAGIALGLLHGSDPVDEYALIFGAGGGASLGIALSFYLTRPQEPR